MQAVHHTVLRSRYLWQGCTKKRVEKLPPGEDLAFNLVATFFEPGEYNLNRFRFTVDQGTNKKPRVFFFPLQHLARVGV